MPNLSEHAKETALHLIGMVQEKLTDIDTEAENSKMTDDEYKEISEKISKLNLLLDRINDEIFYT